MSVKPCLSRANLGKLASGRGWRWVFAFGEYRNDAVDQSHTARFAHKIIGNYRKCQDLTITPNHKSRESVIVGQQSRFGLNLSRMLLKSAHQCSIRTRDRQGIR